MNFVIRVSEPRLFFTPTPDGVRAGGKVCAAPLRPM